MDIYSPRNTFFIWPEDSHHYLLSVLKYPGLSISGSILGSALWLWRSGFSDEWGDDDQGSKAVHIFSPITERLMLGEQFHNKKLLALFLEYSMLQISFRRSWWCEQFEGIFVVQSCPTLCDHMDCSTPGLPIPHYLPEFAQFHVHWVSDAIQPSHPLGTVDSLEKALMLGKIEGKRGRRQQRMR